MNAHHLPAGANPTAPGRPGFRRLCSGAAILLAVGLLLASGGGVLAAQSGGFGPAYARRFTLEAAGAATLATVYPGTGDTAGREAARYLLVERGSSVPRGYGDATVVRTPVRRAVTLSSTYLPALRELGVSDRIVGHDRSEWVYSPRIRERMETGDIAEVGSGETLDIERVLSLDPEVVFTYDAGTGSENPYPRLADTGLTVVTTMEFREHHPLGRSEWIRFLAAFFDAEKQAEQVFAGIEARYLRLERRARTAEARPTVFLNVPWGASWALPAGGNYSAVFLEDAAASYVFADRTGTGTLFLDFETVLAEAGEAAFWLNPGQWESLADGRAQDRRFRLFEAFRSGRVYNNDRRTAENGGNDYFESGYLYADRVLADLIAIFHPELMPDHELYYYRRLE